MLLALDQSLVLTGWVILSPDRAVRSYGTIRTDPPGKKARATHIGAIDAQRCAIIARGLMDIGKSGIRVVAAELPAGSRGARSAKALGMAQGVVVAFATMDSYPLAWVSAADAKRALTCNGGATKEEMVSAAVAAGVDRNVTGFDTMTRPAREAVADAMGVGLAAMDSDIVKAALLG